MERSFAMPTISPFLPSKSLAFTTGIIGEGLLPLVSTWFRRRRSISIVRCEAPGGCRSHHGRRFCARALQSSEGGSKRHLRNVVWNFEFGLGGSHDLGGGNAGTRFEQHRAPFTERNHR